MAILLIARDAADLTIVQIVANRDAGDLIPIHQPQTYAAIGPKTPQKTVRVEEKVSTPRMDALNFCVISLEVIAFGNTHVLLGGRYQISVAIFRQSDD